MKINVLPRFLLAGLLGLTTLCFATLAQADLINVYARMDRPIIDNAKRTITFRGRLYSDKNYSRPLAKAGLPMMSHVRNGAGQRVAELPRVVTDRNGSFTTSAPFGYFTPGSNKYGTTYKVYFDLDDKGLKINGVPVRFAVITSQQLKVLPDGQIQN